MLSCSVGTTHDFRCKERRVENRLARNIRSNVIKRQKHTSHTLRINVAHTYVCVCMIARVLHASMEHYATRCMMAGNVGVRSVLASDSASTLALLSRMVATALSIVTGVFSANVIVAPKHAVV